MSAYWEDKKVLVTGSDGFIGSHLAERLVAEGAQVRAFVYYNSLGTHGWLDGLSDDMIKNLDLFAGDIRDPNRVLEAITDIDVVFHLASLIAIPYSYSAPDSYVQTNIGGALNVLNACKKVGIERLVHTSTSEVYGTATYTPIDEDHPLQGQSPYSASKIGADMLVESYYRSFDLPAVTVRPFNTYGPRQSSRAVIPTILTQLLSGATEIKLGSIDPTRDFNYVQDTVSGFLAIAESKNTDGEIFNLGTGREVSIGELVEILISLTGKSAKIVLDEQRLRPQKSEVERLLCNPDKAKKLANWESKISLEEGLEQTIIWMKNHLELRNIGKYSI